MLKADTTRDLAWAKVYIAKLVTSLGPVTGLSPVMGLSQVNACVRRGIERLTNDKDTRNGCHDAE